MLCYAMLMSPHSQVTPHRDPPTGTPQVIGCAHAYRGDVSKTIAFKWFITTIIMT